MATEGPAATPEPLTLEPNDPRKTVEWLAVLGAADIPYQLERREHGNWRVLIDAEHAARARQQISEFEDEARWWPPPTPTVEPWTEELAASSLLAALALLVFFAVTGAATAASPWFANGAADATRIVAGQWWRAVTAITLHGDMGHVLGNAFCCYLLGAVVCRRVGQGSGWLFILLTGIAGNLITAFGYRQGHLAVGASGAVFGAIGMLAALRAMDHIQVGRINFRGIGLPLLAALALLGLLSSAPRTDLMAHLFGGLSGLPLGLLAWRWRDKRDRRGWQTGAGLVAILIVAGCWGLAFS